MLSFFGDQCLKDAVVARVKEHQRLDQIIQGSYWDGVRGCAIGCVLHSGNHIEFERQLGLPIFLAYMDEHIFELMTPAESRTWPLRFIQAVPVGVDLELIFPRFMFWLLSDPQGMRKYANARTLSIIDELAEIYARRVDGIPFDSEAVMAAWAAAHDTSQAAWADNAAVAAWAAWAAVAARAAVAAAEADAVRVNNQAEYLISLLQSYESKPIMVYQPCEERVFEFK